MTPKRLRLLLFLTSLLWVAHGCVLIAAAVAPELEAVTHVANVAREKDVVWLSLITAIVAIGFSAWLVRQLVNQQASAVQALRELKDELASRPCVLEVTQHQKKPL